MRVASSLFKSYFYKKFGMKFSGQILKMAAENAKPIQYYLDLGGDLLHMNGLFGKNLEWKHVGYECVNCGTDEKIFRMGFCKRCFFESPYASDSIIRPELSRAHLGEQERDLEVEKSIQLAPHIVYLAYTGDVKVGVTRESQIPTRWIDQGATFALPIARTNNRYEAGVIEVEMKKHIADKTNYKKMLLELSDDFEDEVDLLDFRNKIAAYFPNEMKNFALDENDFYQLDFPYEAPATINVLTFEKTPQFSGELLGIKGQYLYFSGGNFLNIRAHEGYVVEVEVSAK